LSYVLRETAKCIVAAAGDFITSGRPPAPPVEVEGLWYEVLDSQAPRDAAISKEHLTTAAANGWTPEARLAWMMNIFQTDERYASGWHVADQVMIEFPAEFAQEIERRWQKRSTKTW
jgi:hypothetical protein